MRIKCKTPSTGRAVNFTLVNVSSDWTTVSDAPDFSVPDTSVVFPARDPDDESRAIRPGEYFFLTPMFARNKTEQDCWIELRILFEDGTIVECPGRMYIPGLDTALAPLQGRSLVKRLPLANNGDRLQVRAQYANSLDIWITAEEKLSSEHIGVVV